MWNEKTTKPFLIIYVCCLFLASFFIIPTLTSLYYYAWGKHLDWSYFDGPPMIAYFFYISHAIFGNTFFSINIVGYLCFVAGTYYIYKTGCLLRDKQTGLISALIWIVLPTTTESVFVRVLYDAPLNLFTILTFYHFARYLVQKRILDIYLSAFFIGAMILSKYTSAVSLVSLLLYLIFSKQRELFKSIHFYLGCFVLVMMVVPLLYWNANHDWISFTYLLNFHSQSQGKTTTLRCLMELIVALGINYSIFLLFAIVGGLKYRHDKKSSKEPNSILEFNYFVLIIGLIFWFIATLLGGEARAIYLAPLGINIALVAGYCITQYHYGRVFKFVYPFFLIFSLITIVANSWPVATYLKKGIIYNLIQNALQQPVLGKEQPIVTSYYTNAAILSFFKPSQPIYAIPCGDINQYQYWGQSFLNDLSQGKIDKISYVDFRDTKQCAEQFFNKCEAVATISYSKMIPVVHKLTRSVDLLVYECSSPRLIAKNA
jgi:4-amino-4-deoxy-L-arabinose transferase-like glycosyltransferase